MDDINMSDEPQSEDSFQSGGRPLVSRDLDKLWYHISLQDMGEKLQKAANLAFPSGSQSRYSHVYVLMLSWEDEDPTLPVSLEVDQLSVVFEHTYRFDVEKWKIPSDGSHKKLNQKVLDFIELGGDSKDDLKIVYYGGHGMLGSNRQSCWASRPTADNSANRTVKWSGIQHALEEAESDVLLLFDCCASGTANTDVGRGVTELVAACGFNARANPVGAHSFTSALIAELELLSYVPCFTIGTLYNRVLCRVQNWMPTGREIQKPPLHVVLTQSRKLPRSIQLSRRPAAVQTASETIDDHLLQTGGIISSYQLGLANHSYDFTLKSQIPGCSLPSSSLADSLDQASDPTSASILVDGSLEAIFPRIALTIRLKETMASTDLSVDLFTDWLRMVPTLAEHVKIEAGFASCSTLLIISIPIAMWCYLDYDPAVSVIGLVKSSNLLQPCLSHPQKTNAKGYPSSVDKSTGYPTTVKALSDLDFHGRPAVRQPTTPQPNISHPSKVTAGPTDLYVEPTTFHDTKSAHCLEYFCDISSMYEFLDYESIALLEKAIWLGVLGLYDESLSIFETELTDWMIVPVVVYEKVMVYRSQGKVRDAYMILSSFLEDCSEDDLNLPEYRLLALALAFFEISHWGQIERAVYEIDRTREWLQDVSVASYTDVQVAVVAWFIPVETLVFLSSNKSRQENSLLPKSSRSNRPWAGLADLRTHLLGAGRLGEACFLQVKSSQLRIYSWEAMVRLYRETLSLLPATTEDPNAWQKLLLIKVQLRTGLLETLVEYKTLDQVQSDISLLEKELDELESSFDLGPNSMRRTKFYLRLCLARIRLIPETNYQEIYSQSMLLLQSPYTESHREITTCYLRAALAAKALYQETGNDVWRGRLEVLFEKKEEREFQVFGDILNPLMDHWECIPSTDLNFQEMSQEEVQHILEWYESYERDHPGFAVPSIAHQATRLKIQLNMALGDFHGVTLAMSKLQEWTEKLPVNSNVEHAAIEHVLNDEREGHQFDQGTDTTQYLEGNSQMMYRLLTDLISEMVQKQQSDPFWIKGFPGQALLIQWLKDDVRSGNLSLEELEGIFARDKIETQQDVGNVLPPQIGNLPSLEQLLAGFSFDYDSGSRLEAGNATSDTDLPFLLRGLNADNVAQRLCGSSEQQISNELWLHRREFLTSWLRRPSKVPQIRKDLVLICVYQLRAIQFTGLLFHQSQSKRGLEGPILSWDVFREGIQRYRDCIETLDASHPDLLSAFPGLISQKMGYKGQMADIFFFFVCSAWLSEHEIDIENMLNRREIIALNDEVIEISRDLISFWRDQGNQEMLGTSQTRLAILLLLKIHMNITESPDDLLVWREEGLRLLGQADDVFSSRMRRHRGVSIIESLWSKEDSRYFRAVHFIPEAALGLLRLPDVFEQQDYARIWEWVQRAKARALHGMMNSRNKQSSGRGNLDRDDLSSDIISTSEDENDKLISFADLERMSKMSGIDNVVFIDWFSLPRFPGGTFGEIFMIIVKPGAETIVEELEMTDKDVLVWKGTRFNREGNLFQGGRDLEEAMCEEREESPLKDLKPLVIPLLKHTDPGSFLVFCPSNFLHQIPLHALELPDGTVLIHRNPIVYCYSLSVLRNNFLSASAINEGGPSIGLKEVAVFGDIAKDERGISLPAGRTAVKRLGDWFGVTPFLDTRATKSAFLEVAPKSSLLHFHTHVGSLDANPLAHSISLSPAPTLAPMPDAIKRHPGSTLFFPNSSYLEYASTLNDKSITAGEISNLVNLASPCHVTMIACGGGRLRVHPGDQVMGLIPAFMMKGATSVIATLWNTQDDVGAKFTRAFYKLLKVEVDNLKTNERGAGLVNIAKAFQTAIIALDKDLDLPPYYWAGFVLHGWWMYKPPLMTDAGHPWSTDMDDFLE